MTHYQNKNNQLGSALVIVLCIAAIAATCAAIAFVFFVGRGAKVDTNSREVITAQTAGEVRSLLSRAKTNEFDARCTYIDDAGKDSSLYVGDSGKMRIDTTISDKAGHVIRLSDATYIWADGDSEGSKIPVRKDRQSSAYSTEKFTDNLDKYRPTCQSTSSLDPALFILPKGVNFVDVNERLSAPSR